MYCIYSFDFAILLSEVSRMLSLFPFSLLVSPVGRDMIYKDHGHGVFFLVRLGLGLGVEVGPLY